MHSEHSLGWALLVIILWAGLPQASHADGPKGAPFPLYVSPSGDDHWSGSLPDPNPQGTDGPFLTLTRAQEAVRSSRRSHANPSDATVIVREGTYYLDVPLKFDDRDQHGAQSPCTFRAFPDERPVISGGLKLEKWRQCMPKRPDVWCSDLPNVAPSKATTKQLFVDGARRRPASPTKSEGEFLYYDHPLKEPFDKLGFVFKEGDIQSDWRNQNDVVVVVYHAWTSSLHSIRSVIPENRTIVFNEPSAWAIGHWADTAGAKRYQLLNVFEALSQPGEWYLDKSANQIYYIPLDGKDPSLSNVVASMIEELLVVSSNASYLSFEGLEFAHASWACPGLGKACDSQSAAFLSQAAIHISGTASHISFIDCIVAHVGTYGLWADEQSTQVVVKRSRFQDLGAGAVRLGGMKAADAPFSGHHEVSDCVLQDGGHVFAAGCGVLLQMSSNNLVSHNEISNFAYTGVSVGWEWNYGPQTASKNRVEYNHIHALGRNLLSDMGGIYTLGESPGTMLVNNFIHDVMSFDYGGWGVYLDQATSYLTAERNVAYRLKSAPFHQHFGWNNNVRNNVFAFGAECTADDNDRGGTHCQSDGGIRTDPGTEEKNSFTFTRNVLLAHQGDLFFGDFTPLSPSSSAKAAAHNYSFGSNIYFNSTLPHSRGRDATQSNLTFPCPSSSAAHRRRMVFFGGRPNTYGNDTCPFAEWHDVMHQDAHSVLADPLFVNAQCPHEGGGGEACDFLFRPSSLAPDLGIEPIDISMVGPSKGSRSRWAQ